MSRRNKSFDLGTRDERVDLDNNALNRSDISRRGRLIPRMVGFAILPSAPLTNSNLSRRSVNAGVIRLDLGAA